MAVELVSLIEAKAYLGEDRLVRDALLTAWINGLSTRLRRYVDLPIETTAFTAEAYDGTGTSSLMLANYPVLGVTAAAVDGVALVVADAASFAWYPHGEIWSVGGFPLGRKNVTVTYTAGHGASVPADLKLACYRIIEQAATAALVTRVGAVEPSLIIDWRRWPDDALELIQSYRRKL